MTQICFAGDVMTGRGVDQIQRTPGDPRLAEPYVKDARTYVELAEQVNGPVPRHVEASWVWGDALPVMLAADVRVINLETAVTDRGEPAAGKEVHYRMHPGNLDCLSVARPDVCSLANNHVLDYGQVGLLDTLDHVPSTCAGAGVSLEESSRPAFVPLPDGGRLVVLACGSVTSGIPTSWSATATRPGVHVLPRLSPDVADGLAAQLGSVVRPGDVSVVSIHWGGNWGYDVPTEQVGFAHRLVDAGVDVVHGHSSHHPRPVEIYRGKLVLYGCGDLVNDYEGIRGYEEFRDDLRLLYLVSVEASSGLMERLQMVPLRARRLRLEQADPADTAWLRDLLAQLCNRPVTVGSASLLDVAI